MNIEYRCRSVGCGARRERGVVLFVALIAMVVMSLAGVALIRAVDTSGSVAGNLAFGLGGLPADERRRRVDEMLHLIGLVGERELAAVREFVKP